MIDILIPSFKRADKIGRVVANALECSPGCRVIVIGEKADPETRPAAEQAGAVYLDNQHRPCYAGAINTAAEWSDSEWIFTGADDLAWRAGWLEPVTPLMTGRWCVIGTRDERHQKTMDGKSATHMFVRLAYARAGRATWDGIAGAVMHEYMHYCCDAELWDCAADQGLATPCLESYIEHHRAGSEDRDAKMQENYANAPADKKEFAARRAWPIKLTYATRNYSDCLKACSGTWGPFLNLGKGCRSGEWIDTVGKKADAVMRWAENQPDGTRFMFMDADCLLMGDPIAAFAGEPFDVAYTIGANREQYHGVPNSGVYFGVTGPGCMAWLRAWVDLHGVYKGAGVGVKAGFQAYDQYAFGAACRLPWLPTRVRELPEATWNYNDIMRKTVEEVAREASGAAVIHLKAGRWQDMASPLIKRKGQSIDAVVLWVDGEDRWEIKHTIGLGRKNLTGIRDWNVIGGDPGVEGVRVIPHDTAATYADAERNMIDKVLTACNDPLISDPFLLMSDDQFCIAPQHAPDIPYWYKSDMAKRKSGGAYGRKVIATASVLQQLKMPTLNYDAHRPIVIHKAEYRAAIKAAGGADVLTKSMYANHAGKAGEPCIDGKDEIRKNETGIREIIARLPWVSSFPNPSPQFKQHIEIALSGKDSGVNIQPRISRRRKRRESMAER